MSASASIPLKIFVRPERRFIAEGRPTELIVLVRLFPSKPVPGAARYPLNLGFAVDCGGSMAGRKLSATKRALRAAVSALDPNDLVSITMCSSATETVLSGCPAGNRELIHQAIDQLEAGGVSQLYPGWFAASWEVARNYQRTQVNRVIVITDGTGISDGNAAIQGSKGLFRRGVSTSVIAIGDAFDEDVLLELALQGGGNPVLLRDESELERALTTELEGLHNLFSEWATMRFDMENAEPVDVLNEFPWIADRKVSLPPLYGETALNIVLRMRVHATVAGTDAHPLTIRIKSLDLQAKQAIVHKKSMRLHCVSPSLADSMEPDLGVQAHAARLEFARSHAKCVRLLDQGDLNGARQLLDFSLSRFQRLSGLSGGTLLTDDLISMMRLREGLLRESERARNRKLLRYTAVYAQRGGCHKPEF